MKEEGERVRKTGGGAGVVDAAAPLLGWLWREWRDGVEEVEWEDSVPL